MATLESKLFVNNLALGPAVWPDYFQIPVKITGDYIGSNPVPLSEIKRSSKFTPNAALLNFLRASFEGGLPNAFFDGKPAKPLSLVARTFLERLDDIMFASFGELAPIIEVDFVIHSLLVIMMTSHLLVYVDDRAFAGTVPEQVVAFSPVEFPLATASAIATFANNRIKSWVGTLIDVRTNTQDYCKLNMDKDTRAKLRTLQKQVGNLKQELSHSKEEAQRLELENSMLRSPPPSSVVPPPAQDTNSNSSGSYEFKEAFDLPEEFERLLDFDGQPLTASEINELAEWLDGRF
jgi:hypothetical protein